MRKNLKREKYSSKKKQPPKKGIGTIGGGISQKIYNAIMPRSLPVIEGIEIAPLFIPPSKAGGNIFDVIQISDDIVAIYIIDVSGNGGASLLIASLTKNLFDKYLRTISSPRVVLDRACDDLARITNQIDISALIFFLDLHNNRLNYCNAGLPPPVVYHKMGERVVSLGADGFCLGTKCKKSLEEGSVYLYPGDRLLIHSKSLYKILEGKNKFKKENGLNSWIIKHDKFSSSEIIKKLYRRYKQKRTLKNNNLGISICLVEILSQSRKEKIKGKLGFKKDNPVYLQYISYYEEMDKATGTILRDMDNMAFSDDTIRKMKVALTELLANAICHGNKEDHSKKIIIGHIVDSKEMTVSIMDEGEGYNPDKVEDPTTPENLSKDHGRGLFIVKNYVDEINLNEKGNRILIRKFHS